MNVSEPDSIETIEAKYGLSYQVPILADAEETVGLSGETVLEWGGCLPEELVRGILGARGWVGVDHVSRDFVAAGTDPESAYLRPDGPEHPETFPFDKGSGVYGFIGRPSGSLPESLKGQFTRVLSIGMLEHEPDFRGALNTMFAALKPGGLVYLLFSPIWSGPKGHHLPPVKGADGTVYDRGNSPIPPWGHLLMSPPLMLAYLREHVDEATAGRMVYHIYHDPHINRLFSEDYLDYLELSEFEVKATSGLEPVDVPEPLLEALQQRLPGRDNFGMHGLVVILEKPAAAESTPTEASSMKPETNGHGRAPEFQESSNAQPDGFEADTEEIDVPALFKAQTEEIPVTPTDAEATPVLETPAVDGPEQVEVREASLDPALSPVLFCMLSRREHYRDVLLTPGDAFCGPDCEDQLDPSAPVALKTDPGRFALKPILDRLSAVRQPRSLVVKADATCRNFAMGVDAVEGPKLLLCGDTHHMTNPIQNLMVYAAGEAFDVLATEHDRQHLHFFSYLFGGETLYWLPSVTLNPFILDPQVKRESIVSFVGQTGPFHPYRTYLLDKLQQDGKPVRVQQLPQEMGARSYNQSLLSLNISLNGDFNLRVMEVLAAGGCLITDRLGRQSGLYDLFEENKHFIGFSSYEELCEKIDYYLANPEAAVAIAKAGHRAFLERCHPERLRELMHDVLAGKPVDACFSASADPRCEHAQPASTEELELRASLYETVQELHRVSDRVPLLCWGALNPKILTDLSDLPRLEMHWNACPNTEPSQEIFRACAVDDLISFNPVGSGYEAGLVICAAEAVSDFLEAGIPAETLITVKTGGSPASAGREAGFASRGYQQLVDGEHFAIYQNPVDRA